MCVFGCGSLTVWVLEGLKGWNNADLAVNKGSDDWILLNFSKEQSCISHDKRIKGKHSCRSCCIPQFLNTDTDHILWKFKPKAMKLFTAGNSGAPLDPSAISQCRRKTPISSNVKQDHPASTGRSLSLIHQRSKQVGLEGDDQFDISDNTQSDPPDTHIPDFRS